VPIDRSCTEVHALRRSGPPTFCENSRRAAAGRSDAPLGPTSPTPLLGRADSDADGPVAGRSARTARDRRVGERPAADARAGAGRADDAAGGALSGRSCQPGAVPFPVAGPAACYATAPVPARRLLKLPAATPIEPPPRPAAGSRSARRPEPGTTSSGCGPRARRR
jgi:hypothetical protein